MNHPRNMNDIKGFATKNIELEKPTNDIHLVIGFHQKK